MPNLPMRSCTVPGCPVLSTGGPCEQHRKQRRQEADSRKDRATRALYDTQRWHRFRAAYLASHPLCVDPFGLHGDTPVLAKIVDHIQDHHGDERLAWDEDNLQGLCVSCHSTKTAREHGGWANRERG